MSDTSKVHWSSDHIQLDETLSAAEALELLEDTTARWVIMGDRDTETLSACETAEALSWLEQLDEEALQAETLASVLHLDTSRRAAVARSRLGVIAAHPEAANYVHKRLQSWVPYIVIEDEFTVVLGGAHVGRNVSDRSAGKLPMTSPDSAGSINAEASREDEGSRPVRYPDIQLEGEALPGKYVEFVVDALLEKSDRAQEAALNITALDDDWTELELTAHISSPLVEFDQEEQGTVTVFRNEASVAAVFHGRVSSEAKTGDAVPVDVAFFHAQRFCGAAQRTFTLGGGSRATDIESRGLLSVDVEAESPDLAVYITRDNHRAGQRLKWRVVTPRFDGLPPKLDGEIELGFDPATTASTLFARYARLKAGEHVRAIHGFGTQLWELAPEFFKDVYWALDHHYQRALTIQFVTDDPYLPWELMRPTTADGSEIHLPLAVQHCTGRWLSNWDGYMPASIDAGSLYTLAPKYRSVSARLPRAQAESQTLVERFSATALEGNRDTVFEFLEDKVTTDAVAMLHFAGHGEFSSAAASESALKLEDGLLTAAEVGVPEVTLGKRCRTLVFLNACEVGASGDLLGEVGGWADVFLKKHFGGFIAPLWAVEDQDASVVAEELVQGVMVDQQPIGEVLRRIRQTHGDVAPTFYSYLYYGDVTARVKSEA